MAAAADDNNDTIVLIGPRGVGKSILAATLAENPGEHTESVSTILASYLSNPIECSDGRNVNVACWDTSGQFKYRMDIVRYYKNANVAIVVFDVNNRDTFEKCHLNAQATVRELLSYARADLKILLVGNKVDLVTGDKSKAVPIKDVCEYINARRQDYPDRFYPVYVEANALEGKVYVYDVATDAAPSIIEAGLKGLVQAVVLGDVPKVDDPVVVKKTGDALALLAPIAGAGSGGGAAVGTGEIALDGTGDHSDDDNAEDEQFGLGIVV